MNEKELQVIKETELLCRNILVEAENESMEILIKAKKEAEEKYKSLIKEANDEGDCVLKETEAKMHETKALLLEDLSKEVESIQWDSDVRIMEAADKIFERMWMHGNCKNV